MVRERAGRGIYGEKAKRAAGVRYILAAGGGNANVSPDEERVEAKLRKNVAVCQNANRIARLV